LSRNDLRRAALFISSRMYLGTFRTFLSDFPFRGWNCQSLACGRFIRRQVAVRSQHLVQNFGVALDVPRRVVPPRRLPGGMPHHAADDQWGHSGIPEPFAAGASKIVSGRIFDGSAGFRIGRFDFDPRLLSNPGDDFSNPLRFRSAAARTPGSPETVATCRMSRWMIVLRSQRASAGRRSGPLCRELPPNLRRPSSGHDDFPIISVMVRVRLPKTDSPFG
jgi:hypothetical protein